MPNEIQKFGLLEFLALVSHWRERERRRGSWGKGKRGALNEQTEQRW